MPSPPHSPLSPATSLLSAPFLPWRLAAVACNNFSHRFYLSLHPAGAIADCFHVSPLLSGVTFSCKIAHIHLSCPLAPLCSLYIASYLNSQLFSWLNKPRISYSKVIRALLESYIATWLFWYPFTSSLPADKGLEFLYIYICENSLFYWAGILSMISALRQSRQQVVFYVLLGFLLSLLWHGGKKRGVSKELQDLFPMSGPPCHATATCSSTAARLWGMHFRLGYARMDMIAHSSYR